MHPHPQRCICNGPARITQHLKAFSRCSRPSAANTHTRIHCDHTRTHTRNAHKHTHTQVIPQLSLSHLWWRTASRSHPARASLVPDSARSLSSQSPDASVDLSARRSCASCISAVSWDSCTTSDADPTAHASSKTPGTANDRADAVRVLSPSEGRTGPRVQSAVSVEMSMLQMLVEATESAAGLWLILFVSIFDHCSQ